MPDLPMHELSADGAVPSVPADVVSDGPVITMYVAPELEGVEPGELIRSEDEDDEAYERRRAVFMDLVSIPDVG